MAGEASEASSDAALLELDGSVSMVAMCVAMFVGSMLFGALPLMCRLSDKHVRLFTLAGAGMLVGTALLVVIPEGVHTLYGGHAASAALEHAHSHVVGGEHMPLDLPPPPVFVDPTLDIPEGDPGDLPAPGEGRVLVRPSRGHGRGRPLAEPFELLESGPQRRLHQATRGRELAHRDAEGQDHGHNHDHDHDHGHGHDHGLDHGGAVGAHWAAGESEHEESAGPTEWIGVALTLGFVFQLLVDQCLSACGGHAHGHGHGHSHHEHGHGHRHARHHSRHNGASIDVYDEDLTRRASPVAAAAVALRKLEVSKEKRPDVDDEYAPSLGGNSGGNSGGGAGGATGGSLSVSLGAPTLSGAAAFASPTTAVGASSLSAQPQSTLLSALASPAILVSPQFAAEGEAAHTGIHRSVVLGLLVHSAVDGVAVGAASMSHSEALEMAVFIAILMHQAPAAFGFVSFLLHVGRPAREIIVQLTLISAAAPTTALISAAALEQGSPDADGSQGWLGLCLLFAAGSFLYVATVHVLPEVLNGKRLGRSGLAALVVGILAPITLSGAHSH